MLLLCGGENLSNTKKNPFSFVYLKKRSNLIFFYYYCYLQASSDNENKAIKATEHSMLTISCAPVLKAEG